MGWYGERVVPRVVNATCSSTMLEPVRRRTCAGLDGVVLELGFGSGANAPFYPPTVRRILAVEPSDVAWRLGEPRRAAASVPIDRAGTDAAGLDLPDSSVDGVLSTWTLCTIPDVERALAEARRVLRPGAMLVVAEHGLAPDEAVRRWQRRLDPVQRRMAGGCRLTRRVDDLLAAAGFADVALERFYAGWPRSFTAMYVGHAIAP